MMRSSAVLLGFVALALGAGCSRAVVLRGRMAGTRDLLDQAERNGAYRCAPRELALARAHLEFAETELAQGHPSRAEEHYAIADPNARAAFRSSPPERCASRILAPDSGDRDGDGIPDRGDRCPDAAENFDGFEDDDGCPDDQDEDGDGIPRSSDLCPAAPEDFDGFEDTDGCPEVDNDLDGLVDANDRCPNDPEDFDGFEDADGCPEPDNDGDGIADADDRCPNEAGPAAEQGCPRVYKDVEVTSTHIRISQTVHFDTNKATIRSVSFPILDTVAQVLRDFPDIHVEVQGHTDSRGNDTHNLRLSQARAESVRDFLVSRGIERSRMMARGYGETRPIESNATSAGRARNRRVEFLRYDRLSPPEESTP